MIRPYNIKDQQQLIELFRLNSPEFFAPSEEKEFIEYLNHDCENYFVVENENTIIGAGGFNWFDNGKLARISWDLIHPDHQGKGLGSKLTQFRIDKIKQYTDVATIVVRTSQLAYPFYAKFGFEVVKIEKDYWAKGFDLYQMEQKIK